MKLRYKKFPYVSNSGIKVGTLLVRQDYEFEDLVTLGIVISIDKPKVNLEPWVYATVVWEGGYRTYHLNGTERVLSL